MAKEPKTAAVVTGVDEVSVSGAASLAYWTERLRPYDLEPIARDGAAEVLVIVGRLKWGIRFREFSVAVAARPRSSGNAPASTAPPPPDRRDGVFLAQAFQTSRLFAWCERTFFHAPYRTARVAIDLDPARVAVGVGADELFTIVRGPGERPTEATSTRNWSGAIYLPDGGFRASGGGRSSRYFLGRLEGGAEVSPFIEGTDTFTLRERTDLPILGALVESAFRPRE